MSLEVTYRLSPQTPGVTGAVVNKNGQQVGVTPFDTTVRTTTIAANGGTFSYTSEKTGYTSKVQYKLFLIRNPRFSSIDENQPDRELRRVFLEYGDGVRDFRNNFTRSFPEFLNNTPDTRSLGSGGGGSGPTITSTGQNLGGQFDTNSLFDENGNPTNFDSSLEYRPSSTQNEFIGSNVADIVDGSPEYYQKLESDTYSNIPQYVIAVLKYRNNILDESFLQLASNSNEILFKFELEKIKVVEEETTIVDETLNEDIQPDRFIRVISNIPNSVSLVFSNDTSQTLAQQISDITTSDNVRIRIVSADIQRYRITKITEVADSGVNNNVSRLDTIVAETTNSDNTVSYEFNVSRNVTYRVDVEEVAEIQPTAKPVIILAGDSTKKYNKNNPSTYFSFGIIKQTKVDSVRVVVGDTVKQFSDLGSSSTTVLNINTNLFTSLGIYRIEIIPFNQERGDGDSIFLNVNVVSEQFVGYPDVRKLKYPEEITAPDFVGFDVNFVIGYESKDTDYIQLSLEGSSYTSKIGPYGKVDLNFLDLLNKIGSDTESKTSTSIIIGLTPYNTSGLQTIVGKKELLTIRCIKGANQIEKSQVANRFVDAFISKIDFSKTNDDTSKLLTHNLHLGDGDNKVISNWIGSDGSLIAKLYEPLPTSVQENQQVWISKLQSNPIVETVTLSGDDNLFCTPLKGPNFTLNVDKDGYGFKFYDELIGSGSATSDQIINKYFDGLNIDTTKLDIEYVSGSTYVFENFVNFGSAEERVNNFFYKIQLVETYVKKLNTLTDSLGLGQILTELPPNVSTINGLEAKSPVLFTEDEIFTLDVEQRVWRNPTEKIEADKVIHNLRNLLSSFDGFENFLYSSTNFLAYPKITIPRPLTSYPIVVLKNSEDQSVIDWYNSLVILASKYDKNNVNYMVNNIPLFVKEDTNNSEFLLFLDMVGQQFDVLWVYINSLKKLRKNDEAGINGVPKEFVHTILKSFGWDGLRAYDSQFLWEYALGQDKDGKQKYSTSLEDANNQIWKRILNNLPYLLKHKGTARSMKAIMATYGVPQTMLTILEFGGPNDPENSGTVDFTFDDRTSALNMISGSTVNIPWNEVSGEYPNSIELMIKPYNLHSSTIVSSSGFQLDIIETGSKVYLEFDLGGNVTQSLPFPYSTENYSGILINKNSTNYEVLFKTSDGERVYVTSSLQLDTTISSSWENNDVVKFGNSFTGALDEVRLWRVPLEESKFENHVLFPNAINGNSYTSSTEDLLFRLDFEYPLDFSTGTSTIQPESIKNVAINTSYGEDYATVSFFQNESTYPYNYIPYERTVTTKVPSLGYNYSNKIRSEEQTLIGNLSHKKRATKGSFDRAPIDSSRLGLFFSPIKELNMDIVKSLGDFNIDNFIGDPSDEYKSDYRELKTLREYYFERIDRNSHEYIRLIKYISKSLFDVLESLAPARAKVSKGLLIEPHFLERSKTKWDKPNSEKRNWEGEITASEDVFFNTEKKDYLGLLDAEQEIDLIGEEKFFNTSINVDEESEITGEERFYNGEILEGLTSSFDSQYLVYTASIEFELTGSIQSEYDSFDSFTQVGMDPSSLYNLGFGLFAEDTTTIWKRLNVEDNTLTQSRSDVYLIEETLSRKVPVQVGGYPTIGSQPGDQVVVDVEDIESVRKRINILPFGSDTPTINDTVTKVTPLQGYFRTHYRFVNGLSTGLERSFYEGSKQTSLTTPDGLSPVETFETNPNILRVTDTGRGSGEPILEVD